MRRTLYISLVIFNIIFAVFLLLSYLSTFISPARVWILAFFGLFYPYILAINIAFIIIWTIKLKRAVFISILTIIAGWNHFTDYIPIRNFFSSSHSEEKVYSSEGIRLISYNVRAFNALDWVNDPGIKNNIYNLIRSEQPDIICLQEYYTENTETHLSDRVNRIFKDTPYHHVHYSFISGRNSGYGMATYSRYPLTGKGSIPFSNTSNMAIFTDLVVDSDTFRIYNSHLQSLNFHKRNYDFIDSLRFRYDEKQFAEIRDINRRIKNAFIKRSVQVDSLSAHIKASPYPVIVCGDFNDTPVSYTYRKMRSGLKDSFVSSGAGTGNTYLGIFPSFRIDYIFHSPEFETIDFERVKAKLSDHYPIICHLHYIPGKE